MLRYKNQLAVAVISAMAVISTAPPVLAAELIAGEVRKVDMDAGKITIRHGPWKKFDMDHAMTMVFKAGDPAMLKQVKAGDKIRFDADSVQGQMTVTKIEKAK